MFAYFFGHSSDFFDDYYGSLKCLVLCISFLGRRMVEKSFAEVILMRKISLYLLPICFPLLGCLLQVLSHAHHLDINSKYCCLNFLAIFALVRLLHLCILYVDLFLSENVSGVISIPEAPWECGVFKFLHI